MRNGGASRDPKLHLIGELYAIEQGCPAGPLGDDLRRKLRNERSRPLIAKLQEWLLTTRALPESGLGKAISYARGMWQGLVRFLEDPRIPLDNNAAERAMRGPVVGRKNHYGSKSRRGTEVAALFYSILETAKLRGLDPRAYLHDQATAAIRARAMQLPHEIARDAASAA